MARRVELGPATEDGQPDRAGSYAGLVVGERVDWTHWFLDDQPPSCFGDGGSCLLGCACGGAGWWPLSAKVAVADSQITWSTFRTGHRSWDLRKLGPLTFHRSQYEAALTAAR